MSEGLPAAGASFCAHICCRSCYRGRAWLCNRARAAGVDEARALTPGGAYGKGIGSRVTRTLKSGWLGEYLVPQKG